MKRKELLDILEQQYPKVAADIEDSIGLQVEGTNEVNKILVTLDVTLDTIHQAHEKGVDMIITHHPLIYGESEVVLAGNALLRSKVELLEKLDINVFVIHTNADWNPESIAWAQAEGLHLENVVQLHENLATKGTWKEKKQLSDIVDSIREVFGLEYDFRTNREKIDNFNSVIFAAGTAGEQIFTKDAQGSLVVVGEVKHHEWIFANENNIAVLEIGHYSEVIFKDMVKVFLEEKDLEVIKAVETNGYKTI